MIRSSYRAAFFFACGVLGAAIAGVAPASAQSPPHIWDVPLGANVSQLPPRTYFAPSCGTNGGPQGLPIGDFSEFRMCQPEDSGLREIWFTFDDTLEYIARALRDANLVAINSANVVGGHPVVYSLLIDDAGTVRGYRIVTDDRVDARTRLDAATVAAYFRALMGTDWNCEDLPAAEGETPIEGTFIKRHCTIRNGDETATLDIRYYFREGQQVFDPQGRPMENAFESSARLEVVRDADAPPPDVPTVEASSASAGPYDTPEEAFLAGATNDCPGCDLAGADLRWRDLTGADLHGADLTNATLHRAILRNADFSDANLTSANLNATDLSLADFTRANLFNVLLFRANASRANFTNVDLSASFAGEANMPLADFSHAKLDGTDFGGARLNDATFIAASLRGTFLGQTTMTRADLSAAILDNAVAPEVVLRRADLSGASLRSVDLRSADLLSADLTGADFTGADLRLANMTDAIRDGTIFDAATMPDNTTMPPAGAGGD